MSDTLERLRDQIGDAQGIELDRAEFFALLDIAEAAQETFREFKLWSEDANDGEFAIWSEDKIMAAVFQKLGPALAALDSAGGAER